MAVTAADKLKAAQMQRAAQDGINPYASSVESANLTPKDLAFYNEQLRIDKAYLASLPTLEEKIIAKQNRISTYWPYLIKYMDQRDCYPNRVAVNIMIWLFDVNSIEQGLQLALLLIKQQCHVMPRNFERDMPTFVCDALYDWAADLLKKNQSASPYLATVVATLEQEHWPLSPPVHSKMHALLAKHYAREEQWQHVSTHCAKAKAANPDGHGTKTLAEKASGKLAPQAQSGANTTEAP